MYKALKNLFLTKTTHRLPKIATLAISSVLLVTMVNIDASASAFGGRDSDSVRSDVVLTLASDSSNNQFSGLVKRWSTISSIAPTATPVTTVPSSSDGGGGTISPTAPSTTPSTTTDPPTTTTTPPPTTTSTSPPTTTTTTSSGAEYPVGTLDSSEPSGYAPPAANALSGYSQTYVNDFTGASLPAGWEAYSGQPGGDAGGQFGTAHDVVGGGLLSLNTWEDPAYGNEWVTGGLCQCGLPQTYGAFFVRARVTGPGPTLVALLFPTVGWPPEIDFSETNGETNVSGATVHWGANNESSQVLINIDMTQWHTWGVIWTPTSITYTVDGQVWGVVTNPVAIPNVPMTLDLQQQTWCSSGYACPTSPQSMLVDWVAEYTAN